MSSAVTRLCCRPFRHLAEGRTILKKAATCVMPVRHLNLHEYQSKALMAEHGIDVQKFYVTGSSSEVAQLVNKLNCPEVVVKAQILAGGRGKGEFTSGLKGGVQVTKRLDTIPDMVSQMIGYNLKTKQTPPDGVTVNKVMLAEALDISRETYLAIVMDRSYDGPVIIASPEGGVDIEEVAEKSPEKVFKLPVDIMEGITDELAIKVARCLEFEGKQQAEAAKQVKSLYNMLYAVDAMQVEINPFGETPDGRVVCFDAKINFDDNAKFRQQHIFEQEDKSETDPREVQATQYDLNYIGMDGNIGCLVNGAGLAMATMDIIKIHNGSPANFLDVGGGVTEKQVFHAFKLLTGDANVKAILVNIFGGIVDCATIAKGIQSAGHGINLSIPLIVRLEGTNVDEARRILDNSGLDIITANEFGEAARKAVGSLS